MARLKSDQANTWAVIDVMDVTGALKGKTVSFTGHLGLPRDQIIAIIEKAGGTFVDRPRYGTTWLITNADWTKGTVKGKVSSKYTDAVNNFVQIISEQKFIDYICEHGESGPTES